MKKRIISSLLIAGMILSFAACASKPAETTAAPAPAPATTAAPAATQAAAPAETQPETKAELNWPTKTITILCSDTGGSQDYGARLWAEYMHNAWGVNVIVQNFDDTIPAMRELVNKKDDHTLFYTNITSIIKNAVDLLEIGIDDYKVACIVNEHPGTVLCVRSESGITNMKELYDYTQAHPYELSVSTQLGTNTGACIKGLERAGFQLNPVDVGNSAKRITALLGKHLDVIALPYGNIKQYVETGEVNVLCVFMENRNPSFDQVPTAKEEGVDVSVPVFFMFDMIKDADPAISDKINALAKEICASEEYKATILEAQNWLPTYMDSETATAFLKKMHEEFVAMDLMN